mgnify:CR=1 FL=1
MAIKHLIADLGDSVGLRGCLTELMENGVVDAAKYNAVRKGKKNIVASVRHLIKKTWGIEQEGTVFRITMKR